MSPSSGVLHWYASHGRQLGIMVRQVEDELGVINMATGAAHAGTRAMCATSGGGFALMTEALGAAAMMEVPVVCINVMRAGPATGVPTKTEQGDLWQALGAGQGDYPRIIVAPTDVSDCFHIVPELFNLTDRFQCPGIILSDLLISEGRFSIDPTELDFNVPIDRGELIGANGNGHSNGTHPYNRYENTPSGISPRAIPGTEGYVHVVATDEHDEDGVLISDEFTNPHKRQMMHEKRMRKMDRVLERIEAPTLWGAEDADVTLIGWGSTKGVIREAIGQLAEQGIKANNLQIKWLVPLHVDAIIDAVNKAKKVIIVENNYSGQFARYLRSETSIVADGHIRKYDGEPFMPHHNVDGVKANLAQTNLVERTAAKAYVPRHEILV
jgi:2-oxoglutarate ferredoxin oxidoreductase subunit alpha